MRTLSDMVSRVRRNHGVEHAVVSLLMARGVRRPLGGYSTSGGFFIFGRATLEEVSEAAADAIARLRGGDSRLAVSPFCGTNLVVQALLAGTAAAIVMGGSEKRIRRLPAAGIAILAATMLARPIGNALQRHCTTLSDAREVEIDGVKQVWAGPFTVHRVSTRMGGDSANPR